MYDNWKKTMRINARLGSEESLKLSYLMKTTGLNLSALIKRSIDALYAQVRRQKSSPLKIMGKAGFLACSQGPRDLSETYKKDLMDHLTAKI